MKNTISKNKYDRIMRAVRAYARKDGEYVANIGGTTFDDVLNALDRVKGELETCLVK